jgi:hypothetical protein
MNTGMSRPGILAGTAHVAKLLVLSVAAYCLAGSYAGHDRKEATDQQVRQ